MLKRIPVEQLRNGMFLHEVCGSWMEHPFWRSSFLLKRHDDVRRLKDCGIREVWIDTSKGLDVEGGMAEAEVRAEVEQSLVQAAAAPLEPPKPLPPGEAIKQAAALYHKSREQVQNLFNEARLGKAVDAESCADLVDEISNSVMANPGALISIARLKTADEYTYMHSVAVCALMLALGRQLGLQGEELRQAGLAGMMHDVGKALMPMEVLNKPGKLTDEEFAIMRAHPERGHELLVEGGTASAAVLDVCLNHHEKIDGSGYPHRLRGDALSLFAKMGAVCDVYDAITSERPYKAGWDPGEALRKMAQWTGHFDPTVFQAFVKTVGIYPIGSLVKLQSGRLGVVCEQHGSSLLTPVVKIFYSTKSNLRLPPVRVDLSSPLCQDKVIGCESPENWPFTDLEELWGAPNLAPPPAAEAAGKAKAAKA